MYQESFLKISLDESDEVVYRRARPPEIDALPRT